MRNAAKGDNMKTTENRALSVSYGSFSVKLEGFDDPFKIMRRVTEYFRSIAAVDPTFGQKPLIEDLSVLEAIETAVFNDDVSLETEGSTITLRPKELQLPRDVFVLGSTDLAPANEMTQTPANDAKTDKIISMDAEQQVALVNTPLDLREMAQNHQEMPFVGKGQQALDEAPQEVNPINDDAAPKYRSLRLTEIEPTATLPEEPAVETQVSADLAVDLYNQEPVDKRPLRIIRSEYAYEEPEILDTPTAPPEAPGISVNPFRKFPKREAEKPAPQAVQNTPKTEETLSQEDDLVSIYRKLRAEQG